MLSAQVVEEDEQIHEIHDKSEKFDYKSEKAFKSVISRSCAVRCPLRKPTVQ